MGRARNKEQQPAPLALPPELATERSGESVQEQVNRRKSVDRRKETGVKKGVKRPSVLMSAEFVRGVRESLELSQGELAQLLGVTNITITSWEKNGVDSIRGGTFYLLRAIVALLKQADHNPEFLSLSVLKRYLKMGASGELLPYYIKYAEELNEEYLALINSGIMVGTMAAMLFDLYIEKKTGVSPADEVMKLNSISPLDQNNPMNEDFGLLERVKKQR